MTENDISYKIRGAIFEVYDELGPGLLESTYEAALFYELQEQGLDVRSQMPLSFNYKKLHLNAGYRLDLLVENKVIIEIKSIEQLTKVHHKQLLTYLKLANLKLGILVNFNVASINEGIVRKVNGL